MKKFEVAYEINDKLMYKGSMDLLLNRYSPLKIAIFSVFYFMVTGSGLFFSIVSNEPFFIDLLWLLAYLFIVVLTIWQMKSRASEMVKMTNNESRLQRYEFYEDHICSYGENATFTLFYNKIFKVVATKEHYLIFLTKRNAYCIPKSAVLGDEAHRFIQEELVKKYTGKRR